MSPRILSGTLLLYLMAASAVWGQATFQLRNRDSVYGIDAPIFDAEGVRLAGTDYAAELWGGPVPDLLAPTLVVIGDWHRAIVPFQTDANAGYFRSVETLTVLDVPDGGWAWLQVRAWDARLGPTYEAAAAAGVGGYGESALFYLRGGSDVHLVPPSPLVGLQSFSLRAVVPEPGTWAMLLLGLPMLAWFCRRSRWSDGPRS